jgi:predicted nucleic acid-binding protein
MDYLLQVVPLLELLPDYWARAGLMRRTLLAAGRKARLTDVLIAQACLDADVALITRDTDFAAIAALCGLKLAL